MIIINFNMNKKINALRKEIEYEDRHAEDGAEKGKAEKPRRRRGQE